MNVKTVAALVLLVVAVTSASARNYEPQQGRFLEEDPVGFEGGINFYIYALDNPLNFTDPYGEKVFLCKRRKNMFIPIPRVWRFFRHDYIKISDSKAIPYKEVAYGLQKVGRQGIVRPEIGPSYFREEVCTEVPCIDEAKLMWLIRISSTKPIQYGLSSCNVGNGRANCQGWAAWALEQSRKPAPLCCK